MLSDFGAASVLPEGSGLARLEMRAFGLLVDELLLVSADEVGSVLRDVRDACLHPEVARRPGMAEVVDALAVADRGRCFT